MFSQTSLGHFLFLKDFTHVNFLPIRGEDMQKPRDSEQVRAKPPLSGDCLEEQVDQIKSPWPTQVFMNEQGQLVSLMVLDYGMWLVDLNLIL